MQNYVQNILDDACLVHNKFATNGSAILTEISSLIANCFANGNKLLLCGNGGSAADCQHIAAEFVNRFVMERPALPAIAMTTDTSLITAIGNDYSFDEIYEKQVSALANPGDIVWGISTSGNSENILRAMRRASKNGVATIGFSGQDGGKMRGVCDKLLTVDSKTTARIQEIHILSAHVICGLVDEIMFGKFSRQ